ncbi:chitotriosidase-1-like [Hydractinia symbiolongicarpus]|uniref:chitotriosidase-1-like n=1 Tax=Hydractinia symbiolongicarpus TaxID=13093 RepID=UPI00254CE076|nr:chitotriosidase-1-like [Hydractinia symbiolongicarpus]
MVKSTLLLLLVTIINCEYLRVCYYTNWAQYRGGFARYTASNYEIDLCTHIIYAFAQVTVSNGRFPILPYELNDISFGYPTVNALKDIDPRLKTLLGVGGWRHASAMFTEMVQTHETRKIFIDDAVVFLLNHGFDGLDLDWEYPGQRGSPPGDKFKFTQFCEELKKEFSKHGLLLTAAVAAGQVSAQTSYEILEISQHLDFINLMAYDLHGGWSTIAGHHTDASADRLSLELSVLNSVNYWLSSNMDPRKLIMGLSTYGRTISLVDACNDWELGATTRKAGKFLPFYEVCNMTFENRVCTASSSVNAPYGSNGEDFVGYDDEESIAYKVHNIIKKKHLGGFMVWSLDLDDFSNQCGRGKYPLIKAAIAALEDSIQPTGVCQNIKRTGECPPPPTLPPSRCRVNPIGPWRGEYNEDMWCRNEENCPGNCEHYEGCTSCMCECDGAGTSPPTTSIQPISSVSTKTSTFYPGVPGTCTVPSDLSLRKKCYLNPNGLWPGDDIAKWCQTDCPSVPSCENNMCCCDSGSNSLSTATSAPTTATSTKMVTETTSTTLPPPITTTVTTTKSTTTTTTTTTTKQQATTTESTLTLKLTTPAKQSLTTKPAMTVTTTTTTKPTTTTQTEATTESTTSKTTTRLPITTTLTTTTKPDTTTEQATTKSASISTTKLQNTCTPVDHHVSNIFLEQFCQQSCALCLTTAEIRIYCKCSV